VIYSTIQLFVYVAFVRMQIGVPKPKNNAINNKTQAQWYQAWHQK
jgi:hypothetical protein